MDEHFILERLAEAARLVSNPQKSLSDEEWKERGVILLKRRILGFCGQHAAISIDKLATILHEMHVTENIEEGREFVRGLYGTKLSYWGIANEYFLQFSRVQRADGIETCEILRYTLPSMHEYDQRDFD